jgi:hypothetical protein
VPWVYIRGGRPVAVEDLSGLRSLETIGADATTAAR